MKVIHLSVECFPIAKVGGLADVVGSLPKYQRALGLDAILIMPYYDRPFVRQHTFVSVAKGEIEQGPDRFPYEVIKEKEDILGFPLYLVKIPGKLDRPEVYMYPDEAEQWIAFQHAVIHYLFNQQIIPDVIHSHDHHVGLIPFLLKHTINYQGFEHVRSIFTVHNGQYQGWMSWAKGTLLPAFDTWKWGLLDWDGLINPMAAAIKCCDAYTTVSEGYLNELYLDANGLQDLFVQESGKAIGIVNGIDDAYWNPETDMLISKNYGVTSVFSGKKANKKVLANQYGLDVNKPLISFIGRFAVEKGADLLPEIMSELFKDADLSINMFILGSGDKQMTLGLEQSKRIFDEHVGVFFGYDESLAHQVYAASDLLLMPSRIEPCGLNQLYAMKYGTIPVVRAIGGLRDTVLDVEDEGYGFIFQEPNPIEIVEVIKRALVATADKDKLGKLRKKIMKLDFSWEKSASKYVELYNRL